MTSVKTREKCTFCQVQTLRCSVRHNLSISSLSFIVFATTTDPYNVGTNWINRMHHTSLGKVTQKQLLSPHHAEATVKDVTVYFT